MAAPDRLAVAEFLAALQSQGSLSALARQRNEGQGTLSKRLRGIERRLGERLVLRGGRRIVLTEVAQRLVRALRETRPVLASIEVTLAEALTSGASRQTLRLGMGDSLPHSAIFRGIARAVAASSPPMSLEFHLGNATVLEDLVLNRSLDAALLSIPSHWPALVYREFFREKVYFVANAAAGEAKPRQGRSPVRPCGTRGASLTEPFSAVAHSRGEPWSRTSESQDLWRRRTAACRPRWCGPSRVARDRASCSPPTRSTVSRNSRMQLT